MRSAVVYGSFLDATEDLEPDVFKSVWLTILRYAIDGVEPGKMSPVEKIIFELVRPNIDKNLRRRKSFGNNCEQLRTIVNNCEQKTTASNDEDEDEDVDVDEDVDEDKDVDVDADKDADADKRTRPARTKPQKHRYGEYQHVLLTDDELAALIYDFGEAETNAAIKFLDEYIAEKGYKSKSHNLAIRRWVFDAVRRQTAKAEGAYKSTLPDWSQF